MLKKSSLFLGHRRPDAKDIISMKKPSTGVLSYRYFREDPFNTPLLPNTRSL